AADLARIGRKPNFARIHVQRRDGQLELVVLPIWGKGYQSTIHAYLALRGDLMTVASLKVVEHGETPGIGAKIEDPAWQALWPGKQLADDSGAIRLAVARGAATTVHEVDGITGATRTGRGLTQMIRFWLGADGYGPVLESLRSGKL
ncbi:MAG: FMN-binding protein, partial [Burkholderiaceae bacterium]